MSECNFLFARPRTRTRETGSARGPRAGLGGPPKPSSHTGRRISARESLWDEVFGGPPKTARQRRALPLLWIRRGASFRLRLASARQVGGTSTSSPAEWDGLVSNFGREDTGHGLAAVFAVNRKISAIQGEDHGGTIEFCHAHQAGIRQVHLAILIFAEQFQ